MFLINDATTPVSFHEALLHASEHHLTQPFSLWYNGLVNPAEVILKGHLRNREEIISRYTLDNNLEKHRHIRVFVQVARPLASMAGNVSGVEMHANLKDGRQVSRIHPLPSIFMGGSVGLKSVLAIIAGYEGDVEILHNTPVEEVIGVFARWHMEQPSFDELLMAAPKMSS